MRTFCEIIRGLREDRDLKQSDVAAILGTSQQYYSKYETGKYEMPVRCILILADFYGVSTDYLLGLQNSQAIYLDGLTEQEKQLLYAMYGYFTERDTAP